MNMRLGPPERRRTAEPDDDTQQMLDPDEASVGWARDVGACEDSGLD